MRGPSVMIRSSFSSSASFLASWRMQLTSFPEFSSAMPRRACTIGPIRVSEEPFPALLSREIDGPNRASSTQTPTLRTQSDRLQPPADCSEPTELPAPSAAGAAFGVDYRLPAAKKIGAFPDLGLEQKVQVGSIDRHRIRCVGSKGWKKRLSGSFYPTTFPADYNEFFHCANLISLFSRTKVVIFRNISLNRSFHSGISSANILPQE